MWQLTRNFLLICLLSVASCSFVQSAESIDLEEIKRQLITESLNSETRVSTVSLIDKSGELKQYSRFYSTRKFFPNHYASSASDKAASDTNANGDACYLTKYFNRLPRSFKTFVDIDLNGLNSNSAQQYDVVKTERFGEALEESANDSQDETGLYVFAEFDISLVPLSDSYAQPIGIENLMETWSGPVINILVTPRVPAQKNALIGYAENSLNSITDYFGYNVSLNIFDRVYNDGFNFSDNGKLSADVTVTFTPDFDSNVQSQESARFSGSALELAEFLGSIISRKFHEFAEIDKCVLEYYKPMLVTSNQLVVPSGLSAGVTQETQFLILPGLPSEVNALNSDTLDNIKTAKVVSLRKHDTVIRVTDEENINLTGYSVVPL